MKTLTFPTGSIGAKLYNGPAQSARPIAIPRDFSSDYTRTTVDADERWIQVAAAIAIVATVLLVGLVVV